jgi:serine/threonine-protein kinase
MTCLNENELVAYVEGLLPAVRRDEVLAHLDACSTCRRTVAELALAQRPSTPRRPEPLPSELLPHYIAADAADRELTLARFWAITLALGTFAMALALAIAGVWSAALLPLAGLCAYETIVYACIRSGRFRSWMPMVSTIAEIGTVFALRLVMKGTSVPLVSATPGPGPIAGAVIVMSSAFRIDARLCVLAGAIGAIGYALPFALFDAANASALAIVPVAMGAVFYLAAGLAAAGLVRYLLARGERSLREIREQDWLGKYIIRAPLGAGGMGRVFRATYAPEGGFTRTVAIKQLGRDLAGSPELQQRFRDEACIAAQLAHPNLVQVLDCGTYRGAFVLAMEYVDGMSLAQLVRGKPLPIAEVAFIGAELAAALAYIHARRNDQGAPLRLVHCDVNPPNVLVSASGEVKLCDFGVMRVGATERDWSRFGGKTAYASPEQLRGEPLDGRADLYGLGLTLYEALVGHAPEGDVGSSIAAREDLPPALDRLVVELCARDRERRPSDAANVRQRLLAIRGELPAIPASDDELASAVAAVRNGR